jgi:hypothetical protein
MQIAMWVVTWVAYPSCGTSILILSKNVRIKIFETIILHVVLSGVELGLTLREEHRLKVF